MTQPRPNRSRRPQRPPAKPARQGSSWGVAAIAGVVLAIIVVIILAVATGGSQNGAEPEAVPEVPTAARDVDFREQLTKLGYTQNGQQEKRFSREANRDVITEHWQRSSPGPEKVVISDDSPNTTEGVMVMNAVSYNGADGKGAATCYPDPEHVGTPLNEIIKDADKARNGNDPEFMRCTKQ